MIVVNDIFDRIKRIASVPCENDDRAYELLNDAQERLANESNWDPTLGDMSICTCACELTLPMDVEVPLAINLDGIPADPRNQWFEFHANGPGSCSSFWGNSMTGGLVVCNWAWSDSGPKSTFQDLVKPSQLAAISQEPGDAGKNIRVYGYDECGRWITEDCGGEQSDGFSVPINVLGMPNPEFLVSRITAVVKPVTLGAVSLFAFDVGRTNGTLLGLYRPTETAPTYRRVKLYDYDCNSCPKWVRMKYRRKTFKVSKLDDVIFLHSEFAIILAVQAVLKFEKDLPDEAQKYILSAIQFLERKERILSGAGRKRIQFRAPTLQNNAYENLI